MVERGKRGENGEMVGVYDGYYVALQANHTFIFCLYSLK